jgi:hypothetical protein
MDSGVVDFGTPNEEGDAQTIAIYPKVMTSHALGSRCTRGIAVKDSDHIAADCANKQTPFRGGG